MIRLPQVDSIERAHDRLTLRFVASPSLEYFEGHFSACALLPGVVQIGWAIEFARAELPVNAPFRALAGVKFMRVIQPGDAVELALAFDASRGELTFGYRCGESECSSGRLIFG